MAQLASAYDCYDASLFFLLFFLFFSFFFTQNIISLGDGYEFDSFESIYRVQRAIAPQVEKRKDGSLRPRRFTMKEKKEKKGKGQRLQVARRGSVTKRKMSGASS